MFGWNCSDWSELAANLQWTLPSSSHASVTQSVDPAAAVRAAHEVLGLGATSRSTRWPTISSRRRGRGTQASPTLMALEGTAPHLWSWPYAWVEYFPRPVMCEWAPHNPFPLWGAFAFRPTTPR